MRAICFAAAIVLGAVPAAYAQGQATTTIAVSVRVIRPPAPRTDVTPRTEVATVTRTAPRPAAGVVTNTYAQPDAESTSAAPPAAPGYRVYTINY
jgi:hypothetical protein